MIWRDRVDLFNNTANEQITCLFSCLNDPQIPKTTNELKGYFTPLKREPDLHKGRRFEKKKNIIKWYLYFKNEV